jgi:hypothetical protein
MSVTLRVPSCLLYAKFPVPSRAGDCGLLSWKPCVRSRAGDCGLMSWKLPSRAGDCGLMSWKFPSRVGDCGLSLKLSPILSRAGDCGLLSLKLPLKPPVLSRAGESGLLSWKLPVCMLPFVNDKALRSLASSWCLRRAFSTSLIVCCTPLAVPCSGIKS